MTSTPLEPTVLIDEKSAEDAPAELIPHTSPFERQEHEAPLRVGQFVIVSDEKSDGTKWDWFGCIMKMGTNYVRVESPRRRGSYEFKRIHFNDVWEQLTVLTDREAQDHIQKNIEIANSNTHALISEVNEITHRLGLGSQEALVDDVNPAGSGTELAVLSEEVDINAYKNKLVTIKEKTLPELFEKIKKANEETSMWLTASLLPTMAQQEGMKKHIGGINDQIFNISLYAGLAESAVLCSDGTPASQHEKLRVMQRRCYMDEECLANYSAGGMSFEDIGDFDRWIAKPENRDRILPFPRTIVAMRVRRHEKKRAWDGSFGGAMLNFNLRKADEITFLYIRNGEQIWRISTEIDFDSMLFPDQRDMKQREPMMMRKGSSGESQQMSRREYDELKVKYDEKTAQHEAWKSENPLDAWLEANPGKTMYDWDQAGPVGRERLADRAFGRFDPDNWVPMDSDHVYFDDVMERESGKVKHYNRVAMLIQGLFDRSMALHPHKQVKSWTAEGFAKAIELVYDAQHVLTHGEEPDFDAYFATCNSKIEIGSVVVGQDRYWQKKEAEKENRRRAGDHRLSTFMREMRLDHYKPHGNPGPGYLATVEHWNPKTKKITFRWERPSKTNEWAMIACKISVPTDQLFNISAYRPGDMKRFFSDPRTRAKYIRWAPFLMAAEDYWAGKLKLNAGVW